MGNRGQKRTEIDDELPADKRACSSLEFRPSSSNSSVQTPETSTNITQNHEMETSSSASGSSRSEDEADRDSAYGSCESDDMGEDEQRRNRNALWDYQRQRQSGHQAKLKGVLSNLSNEIEESAQLAALTELCELLSFCSDSSPSSLMADSLSPILVKLARHESNPDIMLLSVRAITYLCDIHPRSAAFVVRDDGVSALCQRLMAIEYMDVAEQCLQALEKISREQPLSCLQSGAIMAVLTYIDFFSTSLQRVALSTVVNICEKLPSESPTPFMEAVPILCNILQYEDRQLVENVATCLMKIADRVRQSSDMLDELSKHGLIHQATHLIDLNSGTTLCYNVQTGLIGLLVKLATGSMIAVETLFELNISSILKGILSNYDLSHGMPSPPMVNGHSNQVLEVLKLLNQLLPVIAKEQQVQLASDKETFFVNRPDLLLKFGVDLLPVLIQVVNSGVDLYVCYGCLSVINKLVYFSKSDTLLELLKSTNIASFLAGVFTRKDHHVLMLTLHIVDTILQKLNGVFLEPFVKEGVFFAVDALLVPEKCSHSVFSMFNGIQLSNNSSERSAARDMIRCLCYAFDDAGHSTSSSSSRSCKVEKDCVQNLAKHIKHNYFDTESLDSEVGLTDLLQKLKMLSENLMNLSKCDGCSFQHEEESYGVLHQIVSHLDGRDSMSTFEFVDSGVVKSLVNYLSDSKYVGGAAGIKDGAVSQSDVIEKRIVAFGRLCFSSSDQPSGNFLLSALIWKLQSALSSVENFPVILNHVSRQRNFYATVPYRHYTVYPCFKVIFVKGDDESILTDHSEDVLSVDPCSSFEAIEGFLWPKVNTKTSKHIKSVTKVDENGGCLSSSDASSQNKNSDPMESDGVHVHGLQEERPNSSQSVQGEAAEIEHPNGKSPGLERVHADAVEKGHNSSHEDNSVNTGRPASCSCNDVSTKLLFYLEGKQLDHESSIYQAILQQQSKAEHDTVAHANLWTQVHKITYREASKWKETNSSRYDHHRCCSSASNRARSCGQLTPVLSHLFVSEFDSVVEKLSPTYSILSLLRILECMNRSRFHLMSHERINAFAVGRIVDLDNMKVAGGDVFQSEFVNSRLTEKLEQQMRDHLAVSIGGMPSWCIQLIITCPFLFSFEARRKYFKLAALGKNQVQPHPSLHSNVGSANSMHQNSPTSPRKKFLVYRNKILESAAKMMDLHASQKVVLEVEYDEEVGTGLGPTLEFYTLVSYEFQMPGLGMWREDNMSVAAMEMLETEGSLTLMSPNGLFPRPWSSSVSMSSGVEFSEVIRKFVLLGKVVAKALQDGRVLDLPFSKAFYKLVLGQSLAVYDIESFDPGLGRALIEFQALVQRRKYIESNGREESRAIPDPSFRNTRIEDLYLDFTLPGYPDYVLASEGGVIQMVHMSNLEEYTSLVIDATINSGISKQVDAFRLGFNQVFPISHLQIFTEEELECLLCGEREIWNSNELSDHIKFDHGYTVSSPPILNLLEIIHELNYEQQKAFLRFVTGAPRLPPGGLASLNPKLTIVRKHCGKLVDADLPSVMTCANYLKLPPYSSKEVMKEKLLYAITEGQGSFHLS